ncbi:TPA: hypothetical protein ACH3X2_001335 [Trebouxia sp. C0005]
MSSPTLQDDQGPAVIQAAQDSFVDGQDTSKDVQNLPESPRSDNEWEVVEATVAASECGSSAKSVHMEDASQTGQASQDSQKGDHHVAHLHVHLVPQGSSNVRFQLTTQDRAATAPSASSLVSDSAQQQYQEQLRKAQDTLLLQTDFAQGEAQKAVAEPISRAMDVPQQVPTDQAHHAVKEGLQLAEGDNATSDALPSSTHALMQAGTTINSKPASESTEAGTDSADGGTSPHLCQPVLTFPFPTYGSTGELSFMSDGSFINVKDALAIGDELDAAQGAADELAMQTVPAELASEPASPVSGWSQQTDKFLDVARQLSEDVAEGQGEVFEKAAVADSAAVEKTTQGQVAAAEARPVEKYTNASGFAAFLHQRLGQLLSTIQAWTASAYGCLPCRTSLYGGPMGMSASKSCLHRLDGLHWALAGALGLVSAALGLYIMKGHTLQKQVNSSSTELSRLLLKVINLQQSLQSPGRVPIVRHTSSMSAMTPFPLIHML